MHDLGFGERLKTRLQALGYWKNHRPDAARFALERGYRPQYIYAWLRDRVPDYENLIRLAQDLKVTAEWLKFGEQRAEVAASLSRPVGPERTIGAPRAKATMGASQLVTSTGPARVIEHPLLRLNELTEKLSRAEVELQEAIRAWRESEERFRQVFDDGPLGMGMADPEYRIIKVNRRYCEMLGYTEEELCRMTFLDITHPDDRALALEVHTRLYQEEPPYLQYEKRFLKKTGEIVFGRATVFVVKDRQGAPPYSLIMTEDITAQRLMEEELKRLAQQHELILHSVADGIYGTDAQGLAAFVSPAAVRLLGWEPDDVVGRDFHDFVHPRKPDGTPFTKEECPIAAVQGRATVVRGSDRWYRKDGATVAVEYVRAPIIRAGQVVGSVVTFRQQADAVPEPPARNRKATVRRKPLSRKRR